MTLKNALKDFKENILPSIPKNDKPAIREAWSMYIDMLIRDGAVQERHGSKWGQYENYRNV